MLHVQQVSSTNEQTEGATKGNKPCIRVNLVEKVVGVRQGKSGKKQREFVAQMSKLIEQACCLSGANERMS